MIGPGTIGTIGAGLAALWLTRKHAASSSSVSSASSPSSRPPAGPPVPRELYPWQPPAAAAPYVFAIQNAEGKYGLPRGLLGRLLDEESGFRPDVISGKVKSSAGAVGIAQLIPRFFPGVDPTDPYASIDEAAKYLAALYRQFGTWPLALAAYNWGPGNIADHPASTDWPSETRNYVAQITADIPEARA